MQLPSFLLSYQLIGKGWVEIELADEEKQDRLIASYLSDAITDMLRSVIALLNGESESRCSWQLEPGEYRWLLFRRGKWLGLHIIWFSEAFSRRSDDEGEYRSIFSWPLLQFAQELEWHLYELHLHWGEDGYQRKWGHPFPYSEWQKLKSLLKA